jgi:hypothetical protein
MSYLTENLHPELDSIVKSKLPNKQTLIAKKIRDLSSRGENTGIEGNMPKGSSRAYLKENQNHHTVIDGKPAAFKVGTKVSIRAALDKHHDHDSHDGMSLGQLQNKAEGGDHLVNHHYRILTKNDDGSYKSNKDKGIFPPLVDHDHENHNWTRIGHCRDIKAGEFNKLTKCDTHPKGISHKDFCDSLERFHNKNNGRYWKQSDSVEKHLDHVSEHPLVQKFMDYHGDFAAPPHDYRQKKNMGVFEHPDGSAHIVARDHGFDHEVSEAYRKARINSSKR